MSNRRAREILREAGLAVVAAVSPNLSATMRVFGIALGRPDLNEVAVAQLQLDVVRLYEDLVSAIDGLDDELKARINAEELVEVVMQVHANMARTASAEKRALMRNVVVNGVDPKHKETLELRLFVQALADLDMAHIDVLRSGVQHELKAIVLPSGDVGRAIAQALETRGLVRAIQRVGMAYDTSVNIPLPSSYEVTQLGSRFVDFLRDPDLDASH